MPLPHRDHIQGGGQDLRNNHRGHRKCTALTCLGQYSSETAWATGMIRLADIPLEHPHGHARNLLYCLIVFLRLISSRDRNHQVRFRQMRSLLYRRNCWPWKACPMSTSVLDPGRTDPKANCPPVRFTQYARKWEVPDDLGTNIRNVIADLDEKSGSRLSPHDGRCRTRW